MISDVLDLPRELPSMLEDGDLVLLLGAGNIGHVAQEIRRKGFLRGGCLNEYSCTQRKIRNVSDFGKVGLVIGGDSAERQVFLDGCEAVSAALAPQWRGFFLFTTAPRPFSKRFT